MMLLTGVISDTALPKSALPSRDISPQGIRFRKLSTKNITHDELPTYTFLLRPPTLQYLGEFLYRVLTGGGFLVVYGWVSDR